MWLATLLGKYRAELRADFRQYYHLCADDIGCTISISEAADLAAMLPLRSRCMSAIDPRLSWGDEEHILANIADTLACFFWSTTEDAIKGLNKPPPTARPGNEVSQTSKGKSYSIEECKEILNRKRR